MMALCAGAAAAHRAAEPSAWRRAARGGGWPQLEPGDWRAARRPLFAGAQRARAGADAAHAVGVLPGDARPRRPRVHAHLLAAARRAARAAPPRGRGARARDRATPCCSRAGTCSGSGRCCPPSLAKDARRRRRLFAAPVRRPLAEPRRAVGPTPMKEAICGGTGSGWRASQRRAPPARRTSARARATSPRRHEKSSCWIGGCSAAGGARRLRRDGRGLRGAHRRDATRHSRARRLVHGPHLLGAAAAADECHAALRRHKPRRFHARKDVAALALPRL